MEQSDIICKNKEHFSSKWHLQKFFESHKFQRKQFTITNITYQGIRNERMRLS